MRLLFSPCTSDYKIVHTTKFEQSVLHFAFNILFDLYHSFNFVTVDDFNLKNDLEVALKVLLFLQVNKRGD